VAQSAPGLLKVGGGEGLVDPKDLLNPDGLGWTAVIAAVVTVITSLGWIAGLRDGLRGVVQLPPLKINPIVLKLRDAGTLLLLGVALVISAGASLVFGTAAGWVTDFLQLDPVVAGPLTTAIKIGVPLVLSWVTAVIMFRLAGGLNLSRQALLEGTILAAVGTTVLQVFSTELLAGAGRNPILAPFAIIIGLLIWFNLGSQVYLVSAGWAAVREADLRAVATSRRSGIGRPRQK
jgi:membrane protein